MRDGPGSINEYRGLAESIIDEVEVKDGEDALLISSSKGDWNFSVVPSGDVSFRAVC